MNIAKTIPILSLNLTHEQKTRYKKTIAKVLKPLIEDYAKPKGVLIINWKELDKFSDHPINQLGTDVYKHIYLFVTLMQNCFTQK